MNILLVDGHVSTCHSFKELFPDDTIVQVKRASDALEKVHEQQPDFIVLELALAGHSGMEFLYELRSYRDWMDIPVVIYSRVRIAPEIVESRAWQSLGVAAVFYKPESSLAHIKNAVQKLGVTQK